ncbi:MAG: diguanylate cyclase [Colwellia sp.]|nr:diguanylate cyclase [Colwellia sp.]
MTDNSLSTKVKTIARLTVGGDEALLGLTDLVAQYGDIACQEILQQFADMTFEVEEASLHWQNICQHVKKMSAALDRPVSLVAGCSDYFSNNCKKINNFAPKLINFYHYERLINDSTYDKLTGLLNRNYFNEILNQQLALAKRLGTQFSMLFIDVDDFKQVNDIYGHQAGDYVLSEISTLMLKEIRDSDTALRYGGEEFVVLMPNTACNDSLILANRIREKVLEHSFDIRGQVINMTISGGVSSYPVHASDAEELIFFADTAVYRAKGAGKNNISLYKEENRRYLRITFSEKVQIKELGFSESAVSQGISKDIGIGGILFESSKSHPIGCRLQISLEINSTTPIFLLGIVVRVELVAENLFELGLALSFDEMEKVAKNKISNLLAVNRCTNNY